MTLSDSILLQISNKKITYNDLLTRILPNYSSKSSAKAALSRALKNLIAFENIVKIEDHYELTTKGKTIVESKLKNKMLISINELISKTKKNKNLNSLDEIIKNLQIFIERSKHEPTLLRIGKTSSTFYISDIINIKKELSKTIKHYTYLLNSLEKQILILQEQNFVDQRTVSLDNNGMENILHLCEFYNIDEIVIEIDRDSDIINLFKNNFEFNFKSEGVFKLNIENFEIFKKIIFNNLELILNSYFKIFINEITVYVKGSKMIFVGPHNLIVDIK